MGKLASVMVFGILMSFFLYVGSELTTENTLPDGRTHLFAPAFVTFIEDFNDPSKTLVDAIVNSVLTPEVLLGGAVTAIVATLTGIGLTFIIPAIMLGAVANFLLFPTSIINSLGLPTELQWLMISLFQSLLVIGYLAFIGGRDP